MLKRKKNKMHKLRHGSKRIALRSVVSGSVFYFDDDGYAKGNPALGGPGRSALETAAAKRDEDGFIFFPVAVGEDGEPTPAQLEPWMKPDVGRIGPPDILLNRIWGPLEEERLAAYQGEHDERLSLSVDNANMHKEQHGVPVEKKGRGRSK